MIKLLHTWDDIVKVKSNRKQNLLVIEVLDRTVYVLKR